MEVERRQQMWSMSTCESYTSEKKVAAISKDGAMKESCSDIESITRVCVSVCRGGGC